MCLLSNDIHQVQKFISNKTLNRCHFGFLEESRGKRLYLWSSVLLNKTNSHVLVIIHSVEFVQKLLAKNELNVHSKELILHEDLDHVNICSSSFQEVLTLESKSESFVAFFRF